MKSRGFTLLEVIVAIFILTVGVGGTFSLIQQTLYAASISESKLIASYLAQEGVEIVKNIRDRAWLEKRELGSIISWDEYLPEGDWQADYFYQTLQGHPYSDEPLNVDDSSGYNYSSGSPTKFRRKISISEKTDLDEDGEPDKMKTSVKVIWKERGREHTIEILEYIYNWYEKRR